MMRGSSPYSWMALVAVFCSGTGAAIGACSDDPLQVPPGATTGSGGQGGSGGEATTTTTTTTTTTSTGPATTCDMACAHAAECGLDLCAQAGIMCGDPQYECPSQCILDANCLQILSILTGNVDPRLAGCLSACQGGTGGGGGGGESCQTCILTNNCIAPLQSCTGATDCDPWLMCVGDCGQNNPQPPCFDACDAQFPGAAPAYSLFYSCACTSCDMSCGASVDPCNQGTGGGGGGGAGGAGGAAGTGGTGGMP